MKTSTLLLLVLLTAGVVSGRQGRGFDFAAIQESLLVVPPKMQTRWLRERGYEIPGMTEYLKPESSGLHLVGKWGRGRSWEVTGQDSLVFLSLGSQVAILNFADPARPELITELQLDYLALQARVRDSVLVTGRNGIDLWSIADPARPRHLSHIPCFVSDFDVVDTFLYFVSADTFDVYNIARPDDPVRLGFCRDSGYVVTATRNTAVLLTRDFLTFIDVSDPTAPYRAGTYGGWPLAAAARGNLLCATFSNPSRPEESWFDAIDISNPASPVRLARIAGIDGVDLVLADSFAFSPGLELYQPLRIVNIADSAHPYVQGELGLTGHLWGIWASPALGRCLVASDHVGLQSVDITDPDNPQLDTTLLRADKALDLWVDGDRLYVANDRGGLRVLDVSDPARPVELGVRADAGAKNETAVARDSFAFVGWWPSPTFRTISVSDPMNPQQVATLSVPSKPVDMVLRDTLVYAAGRLRFYIVNVARPREPVLVGSCALPHDSWKVILRDTLAYVANVTSLQVVNIARPDNPAVIGSWNGRILGLDIIDTVAITASSYYGTVALSIANPAAPYVLDSLPITDWLADALIVDTLAYVGGNTLHIINVTDPGNLRKVGAWSPPYTVRRIVYEPPYIYLACYDAGVVILEQTEVGLAEEQPQPYRGFRQVRVFPSPSGQSVSISGNATASMRLRVIDACGREVMRQEHVGRAGQVRMDISYLTAGLYFVEIESEGQRDIGKFVKQ